MKHNKGEGSLSGFSTRVPIIQNIISKLFGGKNPKLLIREVHPNLHAKRNRVSE